ncbi:MAG: hypothetical protein ACI94Y_004050 [Maribacter sp.]|jgi:hypothetical protein
MKKQKLINFIFCVLVFLSCSKEDERETKTPNLAEYSSSRSLESCLNGINLANEDISKNYLKFELHDSIVLFNPKNYLYVKNQLDTIYGIKGSLGLTPREDFNKYRLVRNSLIESECYEETMNWHLKGLFKITPDQDLEQFFIKKFNLEK